MHVSLTFEGGHLSSFRILAGGGSRGHRLGCLCLVLRCVGLRWRDLACHAGDWRSPLNSRFLGATPVYGQSAAIVAGCRFLGCDECDCVHGEYYDVCDYYETYT